MKILFGCSLLLISSVVHADPTQPAAGWMARTQVQTALPTAQPLKLQLIKKNADGWLAIVDGEQVRKGQHIANYTVLDITAKQVVIERNGNQHILKLHNTAIKQYE